MVNIGGVFDGSMASEGTGARVKVKVDLPKPLPDIPLVDKHVPGFKRGGEVGKTPTRSGRGGKDAPTRRQTSPSRAAAGSTEFGGMPHPLANVVGGRGHGFHGMGGGAFYCWSCAAGITTPIR